MGPWAPSPEAGGQALILGFTWKMAEPTPLPRTRRWWAACPRAPRRRGSRFREGRGTARPCLSPAQPGLQPPCPSAGGSGRAAGGGRWGGGQAHFCWVHSSPHWGPLHTLLCGLHLSWDAGGVGRSPSVPHHPCGFPALCPHVRPQPLGCPHLDVPSVSSWGWMSSPDGHGVDAVSLSLR